MLAQRSNALTSALALRRTQAAMDVPDLKVQTCLLMRVKLCLPDSTLTQEYLDRLAALHRAQVRLKQALSGGHRDQAVVGDAASCHEVEMCAIFDFLRARNLQVWRRRTHRPMRVHAR